MLLANPLTPQQIHAKLLQLQTLVEQEHQIVAQISRTIDQADSYSQNRLNLVLLKLNLQTTLIHAFFRVNNTLDLRNFTADNYSQIISNLTY